MIEIRQREKAKMMHRKRMHLKWVVASHYGGKCACCGESNVEFLHLHHKDYNGGDHRRNLVKAEIRESLTEHYADEGRSPEDIEKLIEMYAHRGQIEMWSWLKQNDYPQDLGIELLCANCHGASHGKNSICPHKQPAVKRLSMLIEDRGLKWLTDTLQCSEMGLKYLYGHDIENPRLGSSRRILRAIDEISRHPKRRKKCR